MNLPTREEYEFLRFKFTQDIAHGSPSERLVAMHNLMHIMALYASSDELEEVFIKPLFAKLEEKLNSPLHPFSDYAPPTVPVTVKTMLQGQPWAQYPTSNCGHNHNG